MLAALLWRGFGTSYPHYQLCLASPIVSVQMVVASGTHWSHWYSVFGECVLFCVCVCVCQVDCEATTFGAGQYCRRRVGPTATAAHWIFLRSSNGTAPREMKRNGELCSATHFDTFLQFSNIWGSDVFHRFFTMAIISTSRSEATWLVVLWKRHNKAVLLPG